MTQVLSTTYENMFGGMWKFNAKLTFEQVVQIAKALFEVNSGSYRNVYVRGWGTDRGRDQFAICFQFVCHDGMTMRKYIHSVSDGLHRQVGNDLVGWDISQPVTLIGY